MSRPPRPSLRPFVRTLWASRPASSTRREPVLERVLPTGRTHLVIRVSDEPLRLFDRVDGRSVSSIRGAIVGGARPASYLRDVSKPAPAFGADLLPGAAELLIGIPAGELAERHTALDEIWGGQARELRERLAHARTIEDGLELFESILEARLQLARAPHPLVAHALRRFAADASIGEVVAESGYSHRRFIELFRRSVGLTPKLYRRVLRFQQVLARIEREPAAGLAELALAAGYSDQAHFNREFRELAGLTPGEYRALAPAYTHHVPLLGSAR